MRLILLLLIFVQFLVLPSVLVVAKSQINIDTIELTDDDNQTSTNTSMEEEIKIKPNYIDIVITKFYSEDSQSNGRFIENLYTNVSLSDPTPPPDFV